MTGQPDAASSVKPSHPHSHESAAAETVDTHPIRRARPADAGRVTEIAHAAKRHWGYPEAWIEAWQGSLTFTPDFVAENPVYVAVGAGDVPVACYALVGDAADVQLEHLWVGPPLIGRGLGRALFGHAARTARARGGAALIIDSDPNAVPFYERMRARRVGSRRADVLGQRRELPRLRFDLRAA